MNFDQYIINCDIYICSCIDQLKADHRGLLSQSILGHLRNFVEHVSAKIYLAAGGVPAATEYETLRKANSYVMKCGNLNFIAKFHDLLQISASHYTFDPESSERLMLKYYEYLLRIKQYMKGRFGMELLHNLYLFPLNLDPAFKIYHEASPQLYSDNPIYNPNPHLHILLPVILRSLILSPYVSIIIHITGKGRRCDTGNPFHYLCSISYIMLPFGQRVSESLRL